MSKGTLFVTGANGDIGRSVVNHAISQGKTVIASIRNEEHIKSFTPHQSLHFLVMHTDDETSIRSAFSKLDEKLAGAPLQAVIHCAAIESPASVEFLDPTAFEKVLKVNTVGSLIVMQESFSRLRKSKGNLVLASSLWGRVSGPLVGAYSASKWALESLADAARRETTGMGFHISLANIGAVKSRMLSAHIDDVQALLAHASKEERDFYGAGYKTHADQTTKFNSVAINVDRVAQKLLAISDSANPSPRYKIGLDAKLLITLDRILPTRLMDKILGL